MCFSATASFVASAGLVSAGTVARFLARKEGDKKLSYIPLLFGAQQGIEGLLWLGLQDNLPLTWVQPAVMGFLLVAWVAWPTVIPAIFRTMVTGKNRLRAVNSLLTVGLIVSVFNLYSLIAVQPWAEIEGWHIKYHWSEFRPFADGIGFFYVSAVLLPPFFTRRKDLYLLGAVHMAMFAFSYLFMARYLISVWCFLAAVSSVLIFIFVYRNRRE